MNKYQFDTEQIIKMARTRAEVYNMLVGFSASIPDEGFLERLLSREYEESILALKKSKDKKISQGVDLILAFVKECRSMSPEQAIEAIAVDRTRIIRIPHMIGIRAPYENQYIKTKSANVIMLDLKKAYLEAGYTPNCSESLDFICVELDFLGLLNRKIIEEKTDVQRMLCLQKQFISEHIGVWSGDYCKGALEHAETKLYKGWLHLLTGFLKLEKEYLEIMCS